MVDQDRSLHSVEIDMRMIIHLDAVFISPACVFDFGLWLGPGYSLATIVGYFTSAVGRVVIASKRHSLHPAHFDEAELTSFD